MPDPEAALSQVEVSGGTLLGELAIHPGASLGEFEHSLRPFCGGDGTLLGEVARHLRPAFGEIGEARAQLGDLRVRELLDGFGNGLRARTKRVRARP